MFGPVVVALCVRARGTVAREVGWVHPLRFHGDDVSSLSLQQVPHLLLLSPLCSLLVLLGELLRAAGRGNLLLLIEALALGRANRGRLEQAVARAANCLLPVGVVGRHGWPGRDFTRKRDIDKSGIRVPSNNPSEPWRVFSYYGLGEGR